MPPGRRRCDDPIAKWKHTLPGHASLSGDLVSISRSELRSTLDMSQQVGTLWRSWALSRSKQLCSNTNHHQPTNSSKNFPSQWSGSLETTGKCGDSLSTLASCLLEPSRTSNAAPTTPSLPWDVRGLGAPSCIRDKLDDPTSRKAVGSEEVPKVGFLGWVDRYPACNPSYHPCTPSCHASIRPFHEMFLMPS